MIGGTALEDAKALLRRGPATRIAVVGASNNPAKYGNIIVDVLKSYGYQVLPVNLREQTISGLPAYKSLGDVPGPIDIVDVVVPPPVTRRVLEQAAGLGLPLVWLQDGSFDDVVIDYARDAPFETVHNACIMVVARSVAPKI